MLFKGKNFCVYVEGGINEKKKSRMHGLKTFELQILLNHKMLKFHLLQILSFKSSSGFHPFYSLTSNEIYHGGEFFELSTFL